MSKRTVEVGSVGVDSGLLMIGDPCYVMYDDRDSPEKHAADHTSYLDMVEQISGRGHDATDVVMSGVAGNAIVMPTAYGDGAYPVFVEYDEDGMPLRMTVELQ